MSQKRESQHESEISINVSVYAYISKTLQMESTTFRAQIMNYNQPLMKQPCISNAR